MGKKSILIESGFAEPACAHQQFECNGCKLMHLSYEKQLELKTKNIQSLFDQKIKVEDAPLQFGYRNKAEFSYINGKLGYRRKDNFFESFELQKCILLSDHMNQVMQSIGKKLLQLEISQADIMQRKAGLRYVVLREGKNKDAMVNFTFFGQVDEKINPLCSELIEGGIRSVNILFNENWSDTSYGKVVQNFGKGFIVDEFLGKKFIIRPNTFFQTNRESAQKIFSQLKDYIPQGSKVLDLYCGVGTISLTVADKCSFVKGVDSTLESIENARANMQISGLENLEFAAADVSKALSDLKDFDVVVADPPRSGMQGKAVRRLSGLNAPRIIYVSCNPVTLAQDIKMLEGYKIILLKAYDQFPQTTHAEMLCVLDRI